MSEEKKVKTPQRRRTVRAPREEEKTIKLNPNQIKNKIKRQAVWKQHKKQKELKQSRERQKRKREAEALGDDAPKKVQKTLDNTREADETIVTNDDDEVKKDEEFDEFSSYFSGETQPKIIITTCYKPSKKMFAFIRDLLFVFPNSFFYERRNFELKKICELASEKGFTDIMIINENRKQFNGLTHIHLPNGPTAYYRLTNVTLSKQIKGRARPDLSHPEVILNNFNTRLGHRVGRMLGSMFHQTPNFHARRVATFHNQRDFLFFRHHRYMYDIKDGQKIAAKIQEIGPRFTLKLKALQHGTFDTKHGEYEWLHKPEMDTSRRRFFL